MDFMTLVRERYSVRAYEAVPVEDDKLDQVLQAARLAPTAANRQPFQVIVIHTAGREEELQRVYPKPWFTEGPLVVGIVALPAESWYRKKYDDMNYCYVDCAIAMDHLILAAHELGLGTCWIADFNPGAAREVLELPDGAELVAITPLGYPNDEPKPKRRKSLSDLVRYERW
jgi:nitroreductase